MGSKSNVDFLMALWPILLTLKNANIQVSIWIENIEPLNEWPSGITNATIQLEERNNLWGFEAVNHLVNISMKIWKKRA